MKTCSKCKQTKQLSEFNKRKISKDGLQHHCRQCEKDNHASHYAKSKDVYIARARKNNKRYIEEYREWRKTLACECCNETDEVCIDLHHLDPTQKDFNISTVGQSSGLRAVLKEIEKCAVMCSNCHRKIHKYGNEWYYTNRRLGTVADR